MGRFAVRILFRHVCNALARRSTCRNCVSQVCSDNNFVSPRKSRRSAFWRAALECLMKGNLLMELARPEIRVQMPDSDCQTRSLSFIDAGSISYRVTLPPSASLLLTLYRKFPRFAVTLVTLRFYKPPPPPFLSLSLSLSLFLSL